jgi:hypothetical protein
MITSLTLPQSSGKPSVQDSMWCIAYSDNSGAIDMKYVFDVWVNNQQIARAKVYPEPTTSRGYFDAAPVVRNEMTLNWFLPLQTPACAFPNNSGQISINYQIRAGEDVSGVTTTNYASGNVTAYNWVPNVFKRRQKGIIDKDNNFVTNRNLEANIGLDELDLFVPAHAEYQMEIIVSLYDYTNDEVGVYSVGTYYEDGYYQLNLSPLSINAALGSDLINENIKYYIISINNDVTDLINYKINLVCDHRYTPIPLHFINNYGMFETARFGLVSRLSMDTERKTFVKNEYKFNNTSVDYYDQYNVYNESKINYGSKTNWQYKLTMDYPSDAEYQWLNELITSPQIYAEIDGDYYPVTIKETNYEYSKHSFNGLKVFEVTIELNQTRYGFRR